MNEGQQVTYVGPSVEGLGQGERAHLLAFESKASAHIQVTSGNIYLVDLDDLTTARTAAAHDDLEDSLEVGGLSSFAVRDVYDNGGSIGVLDTMAQLGHLAAFSGIAEEALTMVSARIRQDPSFREVLGHLEPEEGEAVLRLAVGCLVRDAFDGDD